MSGGPRRAAGSGRRGTPARRDPTGARCRFALSVATSPRAAIRSSILLTLRSFVQPLERHGLTHESGISPATSGPSSVSRRRMSRRQASLSITQSWTERCQPSSWAGSRRAAISARYRAMSSAGRILEIELDQRPAVECGAQLVGPVGGAQPGPQHEVGVAGHGVGRVVLQHAEALHRLDHPAGPVGVEQLGAHGDPPSLLAGQLAYVPSHRARSAPGRRCGPADRSDAPAARRRVAGRRHSGGATSPGGPAPSAGRRAGPPRTGGGRRRRRPARRPPTR